MLEDQGWQCPVCVPTKVVWNVDHEHVPMWKTKPPEERVVFVRGVICAHCNWQFVHSNITAKTAQNVANYLKRYEKRRTACLHGLTSKRQD